MTRIVPMMTGILTVALLVLVTVGLISAGAWLWAAVAGAFAGLRLVLLGVQAWRAWADREIQPPPSAAPPRSPPPPDPPAA